MSRTGLEQAFPDAFAAMLSTVEYTGLPHSWRSTVGAYLARRVPQQVTFAVLRLQFRGGVLVYLARGARPQGSG